MSFVFASRSSDARAGTAVVAARRRQNYVFMIVSLTLLANFFSTATAQHNGSIPPNRVRARDHGTARDGANLPWNLANIGCKQRMELWPSPSVTHSPNLSHHPSVPHSPALNRATAMHVCTHDAQPSSMYGSSVLMRIGFSMTALARVQIGPAWLRALRLPASTY